MSGRYDDIIHLPHHVSATRAQMSMADRAAQFSPFAALTGYEAAIKEAGRLTDKKIEPDEEALHILNMKFRLLTEHLAEQPQVCFTVFFPDETKPGGTYAAVAGAVRRVDLSARRILLWDGTVFPMDDVLDVDGALFADLS